MRCTDPTSTLPPLPVTPIGGHNGTDRQRTISDLKDEVVTFLAVASNTGFNHGFDFYRFFKMI